MAAAWRTVDVINAMDDGTITWITTILAEDWKTGRLAPNVIHCILKPKPIDLITSTDLARQSAASLPV